MATEEPTYISLKEYAKGIGKSERQVRRWLKEGVITSDLKAPGKTGAHLFRAERIEGAHPAA